MKVVEKCSCGAETTITAPSKIAKRQLEHWRADHVHVPPTKYPTWTMTTPGQHTFGDPLTTYASDTRTTR